MTQGTCECKDPGTCTCEEEKPVLCECGAELKRATRADIAALQAGDVEEVHSRETVMTAQGGVMLCTTVRLIDGQPQAQIAPSCEELAYANLGRPVQPKLPGRRPGARTWGCSSYGMLAGHGLR